MTSPEFPAQYPTTTIKTEALLDSTNYELANLMLFYSPVDLSTRSAYPKIDGNC